MRNLKKLLAVIVAICVLATFTVPAFAEETKAAEKAEILGVIKGSGDGVTADYLATQPDRLQGAIMFLRLKGLESKAIAFTGTDNFADVEGLNATNKAILAYLKANPDLGYGGIGGDKFAPLEKMTAKQYYKVLLVALGYTYGTDSTADFTWNTVMTFAASKGLVKLMDNTDSFTVNDLAIGTVEALTIAVKGTTETLISKLVKDGSITAEKATASGLYTLGISSAEVIGVKTVKVTFNQAVDTGKAVVKIKKGAAIYYSTAAWDASKTFVTLTTVTALPASDYTVEVTGLTTTALTKTITVSAEAAKTVAVTSTILDDNTAAAKVNFEVKNQYGEAMDVKANTTGVVASAFNVTQSTAVALKTPGANTYFEIDTTAPNADAFKAGDVVRFTLTYAGQTVQANLTVQNPSTVSAISLGSIVYVTAGDTRLTVSDGTVKLAYTLLDQYGNAAYLPATGATALGANTSMGGVQFVSSNTGVISHIAIVNDANGHGEIVLTVAGAGTSVITAVVTATGSNASAVVTVNANAAPGAAAITPPTSLVAANDANFYLPVTVTDTYGDAYKSTTGMSVAASNTAAAVTWAMVNGEVNISVNPGPVAASTNVTVTITRTSDAATLGTVTFAVEPDAVASQIIGYTGTSVLEVGSTYTVPADKFTLLDQYGRAFTPTTITVTEKTDASSIMTVTTPAIGFNAAGSAVITATVNGVAYDVNVSAVASSAIVSYAIDPVGTIYTTTGLDKTSSYAVALNLVGKDSAGNVVNLVSGKVNNVTVSNSSVLGAELSGSAIYVYGKGTTASTATVAVWNNATKLAEVAITTSNATPAATAYSFASATSTGTAGSSQFVTIKDQYGITATDAGGRYYSSNTDVAAVSATTGQVTAGTSGSAVITYVASNGTTVSYTFIN